MTQGRPWAHRVSPRDTRPVRTWWYRVAGTNKKETDLNETYSRVEDSRLQDKEGCFRDSVW